MSRKPFLSLDDFKKWMETQDTSQNEPSSEEVVQSKISPRKLMTKMTVEEGDEEELAEDFAKNGGTIVESKDSLLLISVSSGRFYLNEKYTESV